MSIKNNYGRQTAQWKFHRAVANSLQKQKAPSTGISWEPANKKQMRSSLASVLQGPLTETSTTPTHPVGSWQTWPVLHSFVVFLLGEFLPMKFTHQGFFPLVPVWAHRYLNSKFQNSCESLALGHRLIICTPTYSSYVGGYGPIQVVQ